jgi:hypothetical protein
VTRRHGERGVRPAVSARILVVPIALLATNLAACEMAGSRQSERPSVDHESDVAGRVALDYLHAIGRGDYDAAIPLVMPDQRDLLRAIALGNGHGTLPRVTADLRIGKVDRSGDRATVTALGRLCRSEQVPPGAPQPPSECVENSDPQTDSPIFSVHLVRGDDAHWRVHYDLGASTRGEGLSEEAP